MSEVFFASAVNQEKKGFWLMIGFSVFTAAAYLTTDFGFRRFSISVPEAVFWGYLVAVALAAPFFLGIPVRRRALRVCLSRHFWLLFGMSLLIFFAALLWFWTLSTSNSGVLSLLDKSEILFAALLGIVFLGETITLQEALGVVIALGGIFLISNFSGEIRPLSTLAVFVVSFSYATQSLLTKKFAPEVDGFSFAFLRGLFMTGFTALFFGIRGEINLVPLGAIVVVGIGQLCSLVIARVFYFEAHRFLPISKLNLFQLLIPVLVLSGSVVFFPEVAFSSQKVIGAILILGGFGVFLRAHFSGKK